MTKLHGQHVSDPSLALLIEQVLALSEAAVFILGHLHWLALGHFHSTALNVKLDVLSGIWLCAALGNN